MFCFILVAVSYMNPLRSNQLKLLIFAVLFFFFQSCTLVPGVRKNEEIKSGKREDFHKLNTEVLKDLKASDAAGLKNMLSADEAKKNITNLVDSISKQLAANDYQTLDEYYVINKYADSDPTIATGPNVNRYGLRYPYI